MPTHVALLRGINVGGRGRVAMADLRAVVESLGHTDVATYVQSGNVVFTAAGGPTLAADLERAIADALDVAPQVVVLSRDELARVADANPFPGAASPKHLHAVFGVADPAPDVTEGADEARTVGGTLFLHMPDGIGRSRLAARLTRGGSGTARNWTTVTKLLALLDE